MATRYYNGRVPLHELIQLDSGHGAHWSTRRSAARWYELRRNVQQKYGVTLEITSGWGTLRDQNAYRSYEAQEYARKQACREGNCDAAASPGYSSHGGTWRNKTFTGGYWVDAMAFDVGNYARIGQSNFYREAEAVGFRAGLIRPEIAGIFEPWHIIDFDPYGAIPTGGGGEVPFVPTVVVDWGLVRRKKEDSMYISGTTFSDVYATFVDPTGTARLRLCGPNEAAYARAGGLVVQGDDATLTNAARELHYGAASAPLAPSVKQIADEVWGRQVDRPTGKLPIFQDLVDGTSLGYQSNAKLDALLDDETK